MAFDFPNSPTDGQVFTAPNGYVYTYVAATPGWKVQSTGTTGPMGPAGPAGAAGSVTISDSTPVGPTAGQMWWNSVDGNLYIYYFDGSSFQWVQTNAVGS